MLWSNCFLQRPEGAENSLIARHLRPWLLPGSARSILQGVGLPCAYTRRTCNLCTNSKQMTYKVPDMQPPLPITRDARAKESGMASGAELVAAADAQAALHVAMRQQQSGAG